MSGAIRIGIIGMGSVGASIAISTLHAGVASELLLHDLRPELAEGEAMDLADGRPFYPAANVRSASLDEICTTDVIVVAAGRGGRPDESRLDLLRDNVGVIRGIGQRLRQFAGMAIVVSNPVDILTHELARSSGLPHARVLGTGTMLDSARLRESTGQALGIDPTSVHAQVVGEHGDSEVVLWSSAQIAGVPLRRWKGWSLELETHLADGVRTAAYEIIRRKRMTNHAIGMVTATLLRVLVRGENRVLTVSRVQDGAAGLTDVALSLPAVVGTDGAVQVLVPDLDAGEHDALMRSAAVLRTSLRSIDSHL